MTDAANTVRQVVMARRPAGIPEPADFAIRTIQRPASSPSMVSLRPRWLSIDPYIRLRMAGRHLIGNLAPGDAITSEAICEVVAAADGPFATGDLVAAFVPWQDEVQLPASELFALPDIGDLPPQLVLGVLGMPGLTAYAGVHRLLKPQPGETILVSAAAGPVGATVGQLCRLAGARVIGIAGGPEKARWLRDVAGFDAVIDYRQAPLARALPGIAPDGIAGYFDNVGGQMLRDALAALSPGGRIVLCGIIADYNAAQEAPGPTPLEIISARAHLMGLVVYDHEDLRPAWQQEGARLIAAGKLAYREDVLAGLENAPVQLMRQMRGENQGKALVSLPV